MWVLEEWEGVLPGWSLMVVLSAHARHGASQRGLLGQGQRGRAGGRGPGWAASPLFKTPRGGPGLRPLLSLTEVPSLPQWQRGQWRDSRAWGTWRPGGAGMVWGDSLAYRARGPCVLRVHRPLGS